MNESNHRRLSKLGTRRRLPSTALGNASPGDQDEDFDVPCVNTDSVPIALRMVILEDGIHQLCEALAESVERDMNDSKEAPERASTGMPNLVRTIEGWKEHQGGWATRSPLLFVRKVHLNNLTRSPLEGDGSGR